MDTYYSSDKYCIQGGQATTTTANAATYISLKKAYRDSLYNVQLTDYATATVAIVFGYWNKTTTNFGVVCNSNGRAFNWSAQGYVS